jgi:tetratricopeptide (TPR) repeat protein
MFAGDALARKKTPVMSKIKHQFDSISVLLEKADKKREAGDVVAARQLYGATIAAYQDFNRKFPGANTEIIKFRIAYCRNQLINLLSEDGQKPEKVKKGKSKKKSAPKLSKADRKTLVDNIDLCRRGAYRNVAANMRKFIKKHPRNSHAYLVLGSALAGVGNMDDAMVAVNKSLELDPGNRDAHYNLCQLLIRADEPDFEAARKHYQLAIRYGADPDDDLKAVLNL